MGSRPVHASPIDALDLPEEEGGREVHPEARLGGSSPMASLAAEQSRMPTASLGTYWSRTPVSSLGADWSRIPRRCAVRLPGERCGVAGRLSDGLELEEERPGVALHIVAPRELDTAE